LILLVLLIRALICSCVHSLYVCRPQDPFGAGQWDTQSDLDGQVLLCAVQNAAIAPETWICEVMIDGADQAKFRIMKATRWPKDLDSENRPKVKVVGALAHGYEASFTFFEENVPKGSNVTIEVLISALSRILDDCKEASRLMPTHLWVQCDNAGGENKNQWVLRLLAILVDRGVFRSAVLSFLQVGHTHEDLDGYFGVMSTEIAKMMEWDTPMQMMEPVAGTKSKSVNATVPF
jgi:hypothetical protein